MHEIELKNVLVNTYVLSRKQHGNDKENQQ